MARERDKLMEETERSFDPLRRFVFRRLVRWAQRLAPYREDALFYLGAAWPLLRRFALELGQRLAKRGSLGAADDVFFLESEELETGDRRPRGRRGSPRSGAPGAGPSRIA